MSTAILAISLDAYAGDLTGRLNAFERQLAEPRHAIERTFVDMGERLMRCASSLREISAAHKGMPAELESAEFFAAEQILVTIRERLAQMTLAHVAEQDDINELTRMASSVKKPLHDLKEAVRDIRLVAVNARIVAADINGQHATFSGSTSDMTDLGRSVESAVSAFSGSFSRLTSSLSIARSANAAFADKHGATMNYISGRLGEHLQVIAQHRARASEKAAEHGRSIARISDKVANAVSALQIGDITRQRVEHIEQGLSALAEYLATTDPGQSAVTTAVTCRLQSAQLEDAIGNFDEQVGTLTETLARLVADTAEVLRENGEEAEDLFSKGGTTLAALIDDLRNIRILFNDFEQTRAGLHRIACEVAQSVGAMLVLMDEHLDTIREIEQRIRLLSLNTVIQCSRLGVQGKPLMVIAENLRSLATDTVAAAESIMGELKKVDDLAHGLVERRSAETSDSIATPQQDAVKAIALFETVVGRMREFANVMSTAGPQAVNLLETTVKCVSGRQTFADSWRSVLSDLTLVAPPALEPMDVTGADTKLVAGMRARYTMDRERLLHDQLFGLKTELSTAEENEDNFDDVLF